MFYCATQVCAINVLQENATLKKQLNQLSTKQQKENRKNILYYKERSSYSGIDRTNYSSTNFSSQEKNIYEKKGVKFKINTEKQTQKLKEAQALLKEETKTTTTKNEAQNVETKLEPKEDIKTTENTHNADAE